MIDSGSLAHIRLRHLVVSNLRVLSSCALDLDSDLVVFAGENGSGKTSVLEAIHLLSTGRSFRSRSAVDLIRRDAEQLVVQGEILDASGLPVRMGIEKRRGGAFRLRIDGTPVSRLVELARRLPLILITPDSQRLLSDGSDGRRRLVDWLLFHVEHRYGELHGRYRQALRQRNSMLRDHTRAPGVSDAWDQELVEAGEQLGAIRAHYAARIEQGLTDLLLELSFVPVTVALRPGWPSNRESLAETLQRNWQRDLARGFTNEGPHRADLEFEVAGRPARDVLSRGESKLLTVSIQLALARLLADFRKILPVVLVDELASELDERNRQKFFAALRDTGSQTLVTTVDPELVKPLGWGASCLVRMHGGEAALMLQ